MILRTQEEKINMYEEIFKLKKDKHLQTKLKSLEEVYNLTMDLSGAYNIMFFYLFTEKQIEKVYDMVINYISIMSDEEKFRMIPKDKPTELNVIITEFDQESLNVSFTISIIYKAYDKKTRSYNYIMSDPILSLRLHIEPEEVDENKQFEYVDGKYIENKEDSIDKLESKEDPLIGKSVSEAVSIANNTVKENVMSPDKYGRIRKSVKERITSRIDYYAKHDDLKNRLSYMTLYKMIDTKDRETVIIYSRLSNNEIENVLKNLIEYFNTICNTIVNVRFTRIEGTSCRSEFNVIVLSNIINTNEPISFNPTYYLNYNVDTNRMKPILQD